MATLIQEGAKIDYTPELAVAAGDVVVLGDLVGVASLDIPAGHLGALQVEGVFEMPKAAEAIEAGTKVYWDETSGQVTTEDFPDYSDSTPTSSGAYSSSGDGSGTTLAMNPYLGKTVADAEVGDATVGVRLSQ
jgi:predicted RecA/RadA family phage recombinase